MKRTILILLGWMLLSQGCSYGVGDDCLPTEEPVPIRMAIAEGKLSTRAPVTTIDASNLSNVGIYAVSEGSIAGQYPWTSTPFALNLVPSGISGSQLSFNPKLYYPLGGETGHFLQLLSAHDSHKRQQLHHGSGQRCRPCLSFHADGSRRHHVCRRHSHRKYQHHARQPDIQPCVDPTPTEHFSIGRTVQHQAAGCVQ